MKTHPTFSMIHALVALALLWALAVDISLAADTYKDAILALKPIGLWMLDEPTAPVIDSTGRCSNSAVATGTFGVAGPPGLGRAIQFDGLSQHVRIPYNPAMKLGESFWWCGWMKFTAAQKGFPGVFERGQSSAGHFGLHLWIYGSGNGPRTGIPTWHRNKAQVGWDSVLRPVDNLWKFYCLVYDAQADRVRFYVDGQPTSQPESKKAFKGVDVETDDLFLGCRTENGKPAHFFQGALAGIAYGNGTITAAQIRALYEAAAGPLGVPKVEGGISTGDMIYYGDQAAQRAKDFALIKSLNAKWVRYDFNWKALEPTAFKNYDWSLPDSALTLAKANGLQTLGVILGTPGWANGGQGMFVAPTKPADFQAFCYALGRRYIPQGVTAWQIGNEPNAPTFWQPKPDPKEYVQKYLVPGAAGLRAAAAELKATVTIVSAGLSADATDATHYSPVDFLTGVYNQGGRESFDAVGLHPYTYPYSPWWGSGWAMRATEVHALMTARGDGTKKIWATECGYHTTTGFTGVSEEFQAAFGEQLLRIWQGYSFAGPLFWYKHRDSGTKKTDMDQMGGLVRIDYSEKPAAAVIRESFK